MQMGGGMGMGMGMQQQNAMAGMMMGMGAPAPGAAPIHPNSTVTPAAPEEVEQFLILNPVEQHAADKFRAMDPKIQRWVINRGPLEGARDPTGAFIGRLTRLSQVASGQVQVPPGDWICESCGDHQFARNTTCRKCGAGKPAHLMM
mmetsp:Transcript_14625/g.25686  ORF Transcript_14625/g.25686 Transcript_14625/m.25686 type:complete len:146 (-) Transcript_14625:68-505(-)